jgi:hypothetical protein
MKKVVIAIWSICLLSSCSDIFEKSIVNSKILIYTPVDSFSNKIYTQQFYWEPVSGATNYRLQIASINHASGKIQSIILDTIMTTNKINVPLNAGQYEWCLRAQNGGSETSYFIRTLYMQQTPFDQRPMIVTSPNSSITTYSNVVTFFWESVTGATNYYLEIDSLTDDFTNPTTIQISGSLNQKSTTLNKRGSYNWRMYADSTVINSTSIQSKYNSTTLGTIIFGMDTASLVSPANNTTLSPISAQYQFSWSEPTGAIKGEILTYTLTLFSSNNSSDVITSPPYIVNYPAKGPATGLAQTTTTATISGLTPGKTYYWSIMATDANGVSSVYTSKRKFIAG